MFVNMEIVVIVPTAEHNLKQKQRDAVCAITTIKILDTTMKFGPSIHSSN
ncbi:MAG: hypothetical protein RLZ92_1421 [Pseudomonadota bacterium]|jgi:hypothetical protein